MSAGLRISMLANFILAALVLFLITGPPDRKPAALTSPAPPVMPLADALPLHQSPEAPNPGFDWRQQVEASDYPTYIANLRAIRCPEQTVRDIIKADVAALFAQKRLEASNSASEGRWSKQQEERVIKVLFGEKGAEISSDAPHQPASGEAAIPVRLPLILQTQALATLKLTDEQRGELGELTQEFIQEVGGANQDPNDPAYVARWQKAQPKFDQMIITTIGRRALVDLDEAINQTESPTQ
jgi:hypothetical protein